jgi:hypothetical protein
MMNYDKDYQNVAVIRCLRVCENVNAGVLREVEARSRLMPHAALKLMLVCEWVSRRDAALFITLCACAPLQRKRPRSLRQYSLRCIPWEAHRAADSGTQVLTKSEVDYRSELSPSLPPSIPPSFPSVPSLRPLPAVPSPAVPALFLHSLFDCPRRFESGDAPDVYKRMCVAARQEQRARPSIRDGYRHGPRRCHDAHVPRHQVPVHQSQDSGRAFLVADRLPLSGLLILSLAMLRYASLRHCAHAARDGHLFQ